MRSARNGNTTVCVTLPYPNCQIGTEGSPGRGYNVNIPWQGSGVGDADYMAAFFSVVLPIASSCESCPLLSSPVLP